MLGRALRPGRGLGLLRFCIALKPGRDPHSLRVLGRCRSSGAYAQHCACAALTWTPPPSRDLQRTYSLRGGGGSLRPAGQAPLRTATGGAPRAVLAAPRVLSVEASAGPAVETHGTRCLRKKSSATCHAFDSLLQLDGSRLERIGNSHVWGPCMDCGGI